MATLEQIKELRNQTQVSVALCRDALDATGGDMDKAKEYLRQKGSDVAGDGNEFEYSVYEDAIETKSGVADATGALYTNGDVTIHIRSFEGVTPATMWGNERGIVMCRPAKR